MVDNRRDQTNRLLQEYLRTGSRKHRDELWEGCHGFLWAVYRKSRLFGLEDDVAILGWRAFHVLIEFTVDTVGAQPVGKRQDTIRVLGRVVAVADEDCEWHTAPIVTARCEREQGPGYSDPEGGVA